MKKKLFALGLSICLLASACTGKNASKENEPDRSTEEPSGSGTEENSREGDTSATGIDDGGQREEDTSKAEGNGQESEQKLSKAPEVTFKDYSQDIRDEDSGAPLLFVTENCPIITVEEDEDAAERMNLVFEQQHEKNQDEIAENAEIARNDYRSLPEEDRASWTGYGYGMNYKAIYVSEQILSIVSESYNWQGEAHPSTWTSSYCFDAATGELLYLSDIFTDEPEARKIVEQHILDTVTGDLYKDALVDDYEDYIADVLTENTFYLNDKGLVVICNPYMVTSYVVGKIEIEVPYEELKDVMDEKYLISM